jgi:hypothetical protein
MNDTHKKRLAEARRICPRFTLQPELEVDRKLLHWWAENFDRGIMIQDTLLCQILNITRDQYWLSVARLHYLGFMQFPMEIFENT